MVCASRLAERRGLIDARLDRAAEAAAGNVRLADRPGTLAGRRPAGDHAQRQESRWPADCDSSCRDDSARWRCSTTCRRKMCAACWKSDLIRARRASKCPRITCWRCVLELWVEPIYFFTSNSASITSSLPLPSPLGWRPPSAPGAGPAWLLVEVLRHRLGRLLQVAQWPGGWRPRRRLLAACLTFSMAAWIGALSASVILSPRCP